MLRYHRLRLAAAVSRWLLEALAAFALLSWSSDHLPAAVALLRRLSAVLFHPASAFVLGNLIVVTLFFKSGDHSAPAPTSSPPEPPSANGVDAHDHHRCYSYFYAAPPPQLHRGEEEEVVVYNDKAVCFESTTTDSATYNSGITAATASSQKGNQKVLPLPSTRSADHPHASVTKVGTGEKVLRRSRTGMGACRSAVERRWLVTEAEEEGAGGKRAAVEDDKDELRRRIETFISNQLRFIESEEESLLLASRRAVVVVVADEVSKNSGITVKGEQIN